MINGKSTPSRKAMYAKYIKSNIFATEPSKTSSTNPVKNGKESAITSKVTSRKIQNKEFEPQFENISAKERYLRQYGYKEKMNQLNSQKQKPTKPKLNKTFIVDQKEKKENLKAADIMCRDMYNGCDPKEYQMKRSKSMYLSRSIIDNKIKKDVDARTRGIDSHKSNIFFVDEKNKENKKTSNKSTKPVETEKKNNIQKNDTIKKAGNPSTHKPIINRSSIPSNADWKTFNTEAILHKRSQTLDAKTFKTVRNKFHKNNYFEKENSNCELDQQRASFNPAKKEHYNNVESVKYDIISGQTKQNGKVGGKMQSIDLSSNKKKPLMSPDNQVTDNFEIIVPKNFSITDKNTIKNYFVSKGIHLYQIEEKANSLGNTKGKITFKIRRDKNDFEFYKKLDSIKNILDSKEMKLNYIQPSTNQKPRPKTPGTALKRSSLNTEVKPQSKKVHPKIQYDTKWKNREWEVKQKNKK